MLENEKWDRQIKNSKKPPQRPTRYIFGILACCLCMVIFITSVYAAHQQNIGTNFNIQYVDPNAPPKPTLDKLRFGLFYDKYPGIESTWGDYAAVGPRDENVSGDIVIPSTYTYTYNTSTGEFPVRQIGVEGTSASRYSFQRTNITSLYIYEGIQKIFENSFINCLGLKTVTIPKSVTSIGNYAFGGCSALTKVYYNAENVEDNTNSFVGAGNGDGFALIIGDSVTNIPAGLFMVSKISSLLIGDHVEGIGSGAFNYCIGLKRVTIPANVQWIDNGAFNYCQDLDEVIINSSEIYGQLFLSDYPDESVCGGLLQNVYASDYGFTLEHPLEIKILQSIDDGSNVLLNDESYFLKQPEEEINGEIYNVYVSVSQ